MGHPADRFSRPPAAFQGLPFFLAPDEYGVIDGDTLYVDTYTERHARLRFRIRLSSTDAPGAPTDQMTDSFWLKRGVDPNRDCPGARAAGKLSEALKGKPILIVPAIQQNEKVLDRYGRLLADVYFSGPNPVVEKEPSDTKGFDFNGYQNVSRFMFAAGQCRLMAGKALPSPTHPVLEQLKARMGNDYLAPTPFGY